MFVKICVEGGFFVVVRFGKIVRIFIRDVGGRLLCVILFRYSVLVVMLLVRMMLWLFVIKWI